MLAERVYQPQYTERKVYEAKPVHKKKEDTLNVKAKISMLLAVVFVGVLVSIMVVGTAFASELTYQNNELKKENAKIAKEIQTIKVEVQASSNVGKIENTALNKLGMVYPAGEQFIQITKSDNAGFASKLREEAFN